MASEHDWGGLEARFRFLPDGGVDWGPRPFAKRWSLRKLGLAAVAEMLAELVPLRQRCLLASEEGLEETTVRAALATLRRDRDGHRWLLDPAGKWIAEFSAAGAFTFEYVIPDPPALKRGCVTYQVNWKPPV